MRYLILGLMAIALAVDLLTGGPVLEASWAQLGPVGTIGVGVGASVLDAIFNKPDVTTTETEIDPRSREFIEDVLRPRGEFTAQRIDRVPGAVAGDPQFFDPFLEQVLGGVQSDRDRAVELARNRANDLSISSNAFGGSRSRIFEEVGAAEAGRPFNLLMAQLRSQGFGQATQFSQEERDALIRQILAAQQGANLGFGGPTGTTTTTTGPGRNVGDFIGTGVSAATLASGAFGGAGSISPSVAGPGPAASFPGSLFPSPLQPPPGLGPPPITFPPEDPFARFGQRR